MESTESKVGYGFSVVFALFAVLVSVLGYMGYTTLKSELRAEQTLLNQGKAEALAVRIDRWLATRKTEISTLANTPVIRSMDWDRAGPFLKQKHESYPWFYIFAHINPDGTYYNSKVDFAEGKNLSDRAHFQASIAGNVYASDPVVSRTLGTDIVAVTSPIYASDQTGADIIGVFGGMIDTSTIVSELGAFSDGPNSYAFAVNSAGIAISHPDEARRGNINTKPTPLTQDSDAGLSAAVVQMLSGEASSGRLVIDGVDANVTFTPIKEADWYLATVVDAKYQDRQFVIVDYASAFIALLFAAVMVLIWRFRRLEVDRLNRQSELLAEKNQAKSTFLANMSHELRTPMNAIIGYAQILVANPRLDEDSRKTLGIVLNSGRHLLMLINRVLDLSKIEAGKLELDNRTVNPRSLLNELIQIFEIERVKYSVKLKTEIDSNLPGSVSLDPEKLTQIITNIVVNAFKYGKGSDVSLTVKNDAGASSLQISVEDGGAGMTSEQIALLFTPFEQLDSKSDGAGLGMSIVKELVELMQGQIYVDSEVNRGTRVTMNLPYELVEDEALEYASKIALPREIKGSLRPEILIVDDNAQNRQFLHYLLEPLQFNLVDAVDGVDAKAKMTQKRPDLVITDLVMPNMDGFELLGWMSQDATAQTVPTIVASASAFHDDQVRSLSLGAKAFMSKPLDARELLGRIATLCNLEYLYEEEVAEESTPSTVQSTLDWEDERNQQLRASMLDAANLGQLRKIEQTLETIADPDLQAQWRALLTEALEAHDDEMIIEVLERSDG